MRQLRKREGLGLLVGGGPPQLPPLPSCLLGHFIWFEQQIPLGIRGKENGRGPLSPVPGINFPRDLFQEEATQSLQAFLGAAVNLRFPSSTRALASRAHTSRSSGVALPETILRSL